MVHEDQTPTDEAAGTATSDPREISVADALTIAVDLQRQGRLDQASELYGRILEADPGCVDALHFLGLISYQRGDADGAVAMLRKALDLSPGYGDAWNNLGNLLKMEGRLSEAEEAFRRAIAISPDSADALNNLCVVLKDQDRLEEAESAGRSALRLDAGHVEAHINLGNLLARMGRFEEALGYCRRSLELKPDSGEAHHALGLALLRLRRLEEAEASIRRALELGVDARSALGGVLRDQGRIREAIEAYSQAVQSNPDCSGARYSLGVLLRASGYPAEAANVFREWLAREPDDPVARHMLSACSGEEIPVRASDACVKGLFDGFAESFDDQLTRLDYRAPQLIYEAVDALESSGQGDWTVLDAGCGTGLCGALLRPSAKRLVGVDLSSRMLEEAQVKCLYDTLVEDELTAFMQRNAETFDLIVSADTFVYFGELQDVVRAACKVLKPDGLLAFTLEKCDEDSSTKGFRLNPHGRYSHSESYIRSVLASAGLALRSLGTSVLRKESDEPVIGWVVVAQKD